MVVLVIGIIILILLGIGLIYPISHIIDILNDPIITFSLYDHLLWFTACFIIILIIIDIIFIINELEYLN